MRYVHLPGLVYAVLLRLAGQSWWTPNGLRIQFAKVIRPGHDVDTTYEVQRLLGRPALTERLSARPSRSLSTPPTLSRPPGSFT